MHPPRVRVPQRRSRLFHEVVPGFCFSPYFREDPGRLWLPAPSGLAPPLGIFEQTYVFCWRWDLAFTVAGAVVVGFFEWDSTGSLSNYTVGNVRRTCPESLGDPDGQCHQVEPAAKCNREPAWWFRILIGFGHACIDVNDHPDIESMGTFDARQAAFPETITELRPVSTGIVRA
jgi:hypothetical protein